MGTGSPTLKNSIWGKSAGNEEDLWGTLWTDVHKVPQRSKVHEGPNRGQEQQTTPEVKMEEINEIVI